MNPIQTAVAPLRAEAIAYGEEKAQHAAMAFLQELAACNNDANAFNPYPGSRVDRETYKRYERRGAQINALTTRDPAAPVDYSRNAPRYRVPSPEKIEAFVKQTGEAYGISYDTFVAKLIAKVGDCDCASLEGNHVWGHSILTVTKGDVIERWKTQTILNYSVYGTPYNQWPTRKVK